MPGDLDVKLERFINTKRKLIRSVREGTETSDSAVYGNCMKAQVNFSSQYICALQDANLFGEAALRQGQAGSCPQLFLGGLCKS